MISFTKTELEAIAMLSPVSANMNTVDMDVLIAKAHRERSEYLRAMFTGAFKKIAAVYSVRRQNAIAIGQLKAMSSRELSDMGIARCDIEHAVLGDVAHRPSLFKKIGSMVAPLAAKYQNWQNHRAGYAQLIAMDARQLSDIGLTRGDIAAAVAGKGSLANDNKIVAANNNGGRKVS